LGIDIVILNLMLKDKDEYLSWLIYSSGFALCFPLCDTFRIWLTGGSLPPWGKLLISSIMFLMSLIFFATAYDNLEERRKDDNSNN
jgi:hypothetical protein